MYYWKLPLPQWVKSLNVVKTKGNILPVKIYLPVQFRPYTFAQQLLLQTQEFWLICHRFSPSFQLWPGPFLLVQRCSPLCPAPLLIPLLELMAASNPSWEPTSVATKASCHCKQDSLSSFSHSPNVPWVERREATGGGIATVESSVGEGRLNRPSVMLLHGSYIKIPSHALYLRK